MLVLCAGATGEFTYVGDDGYYLFEQSYRDTPHGYSIYNVYDLQLKSVSRFLPLPCSD